ncbi:MAG: mannosyltransferase [Candidatus Sumerlaeota bacterium]|nr:mannosyltransferase [Candidatus Sumerlaeota bacterium]
MGIADARDWTLADINARLPEFAPLTPEAHATDSGQPPARPAGTGRLRLGFLLLTILLAVLFLLRIHRLETFWIDEAFTASLVAHSPAEVITYTRFDAHPPGYYLLLKLWQMPFRAAGITPGVVVNRAFNAPFLFGLFVLAWVAGIRLLGRAGGIMAAVCLAFGAQALYVAGDMRHYAMLVCLLFACWLILLREFGRGTPSRRSSTMAWLGYFAIAALVLWTQLLGGIFLFFLGLFWIVLCVLKRDAARREFLVGGFLAQAAAVLCFLPWVPGALANTRYFAVAGKPWAMEPSVGNLLLTLNYWIVYGRRTPVLPAEWRDLVIGVGTWVLPLVFLPLAIWKPRTATADRRLLLVGGSGVGLALAFTLFLWIVARVGWLPVFEGPRYPVLMLGPYLFGLAALARWSLERRALDCRWLPVLLTPWLLAAVIGNTYTLVRMNQSTLVNSSRVLQSSLRAEDGSLKYDTLYFLPSELIPTYQAFVPELTLLPIEQLADLPATESEALVLRVPVWEQLQAPRHWAYRSALQREVFSGRQYTLNIPTLVKNWPDYYLTHLLDVDHTALRVFASEEPMRALGRAPAEAAAVALPEVQRRADGWHDPSIGTDGWPQRHTQAPVATARFDDAVPPGDYVLHFEGANPSHPEGNTAIHIAFGDGAPLAVPEIPTGDFAVEIPVSFAEAHDPLRLRIERAVWRPVDHVEGSSDARTYGFTLRALYLTRAATTP